MVMRKLVLLCASLCAIVFAVPLTHAHAAGNHSWVAAAEFGGNDANTCTQAAPCQTFTRALTQTSAGGEINCLSDGDYVGFTVTTSIIIDCGGNVGTLGQSNNNTTAITIGASGISVTLRHLSVEGFKTGQIGIGIGPSVSNVNLVIDNCVIDGFNNNGGSAAGFGIYFTLGGSRSSLTVTNTTITGSSNNGGTGIFVDANSSAIISVSLIGDLIQNNENGVVFQASGVIAGAVVNGQVVENGVYGIYTYGTTYITVDTSTIADNLSAGILSQTSGANVAVTNSTITGNGTGVSGSAVTSFGNNRLFLNGTNGSFGGNQPLQ
jgi:hypothetical protein